eukprot:RCo015066
MDRVWRGSNRVNSFPTADSTSARGWKGGIQLPLWLLMGLLVVLSVVAVGLLAFLPVYFRTEATMNLVAAKYRGLSFLAVENEVKCLLQQQLEMAELLAKIQATFPQEDPPFPAELRKILFYGVQTLSNVKNMVVGYSSGDVVAMSKNGELSPPTPTWALSGQITGYHAVVLPARTWGTEWLQNYSNASNGVEMNVTTRDWY